MLLPRGVTGLCGVKEGPTSFTDYRAFRGHCYDAARGIGGSVQLFLAPRQSMACNYALAVIAIRDASFGIVVNGNCPLLAFVVPPDEGQFLLNFVDSPALAKEFERIGGYTLLSVSDLNEPLNSEMCKELAPHELEAIRYFRPRHAGDVIFNYWD